MSISESIKQKFETIISEVEGVEIDIDWGENNDFKVRKRVSEDERMEEERLKMRRREISKRLS